MEMNTVFLLSMMMVDMQEGEVVEAPIMAAR
jgi:hypothetical protein